MSAPQGYAPGAVESRHNVPRCQSCGYVGQWQVEPLLLTHHIIIALLLLIFFGGGLIYLLIVVVMRSSEANRAKICPNCGSRNMFSFLYADQAQPAYGAVTPQRGGPQAYVAPASATVMASGPSAPADPSAVLYLNEAPLVTLALTPGAHWNVGRNAGCEIVVSDGMVSGTHAKLQVHSDGSLSICDTGSTNGTFVNGQRLESSRVLRSGDVILLGSENARVRVAMA